MSKIKQYAEQLEHLEYTGRAEVASMVRKLLEEIDLLEERNKILQDHIDTLSRRP